ncbi:hypothetical protein CGMCC3_g5217 [Colletotrichum fructicola]|nr:uncharacterized protein CGMCC3_g5217 [Colletotrichum fructicola]KAE9578879.1 hypothetical protein CGMCC3_g5217 [Colletotrichum fructicola]
MLSPRGLTDGDHALLEQCSARHRPRQRRIILKPTPTRPGQPAAEETERQASIYVPSPTSAI